MHSQCPIFTYEVPIYIVKGWKYCLNHAINISLISVSSIRNHKDKKYERSLFAKEAAAHMLINIKNNFLPSHRILQHSLIYH